MSSSSVAVPQQQQQHPYHLFDYKLPLCNSHTRYLYNVCGPDKTHKNINPLPGLRIIGLFANDDDVLKFVAKNQKELIMTGNVYQGTIQEFRCVCSTGTKQNDATYIAQHMLKTIESHMQQVKMVDDDALKNRAAKKTGAVGLSVNTAQMKSRDRRDYRKRQETVKKIAESSSVPKTAAELTVTANTEINHVAIVTIPDYRNFQEPLFTVLGGFKTKLDGEKWLEDNFTGDLRKRFDADIVDIRQWIFPTDLDESSVPRKFVQDEYTQLNTAQMKNKSEAKKVMAAAAPSASDKKAPPAGS